MPKHSPVSKAALYQSLSVGEFEHFADNAEAFRVGMAWIKNYLARPHSELGRQGTVCPFAQPALDHDAVRLAVVRLGGDNRRAQILDAVAYHLKAFISRDNTGEQQMLHTTLMLFPDVSLEEAPELIDRTKEDLKSSFVERGLMLGEFHRRNDSPGLHNPNFKPLRSPIPMLAIRRMVSTDFLFLNRSEYDAATRLRYLDAYLAAPGIPEHSRKEVERAAAALRAETQGKAA